MSIVVFGGADVLPWARNRTSKPRQRSTKRRVYKYFRRRGDRRHCVHRASVMGWQFCDAEFDVTIGWEYGRRLV